MLQIRAKIEFKPSCVKDKSKPILRGDYPFRLNHKFSQIYKEGFFIGQVMLDSSDIIYYGDVRVIEVWLKMSLGF